MQNDASAMNTLDILPPRPPTPPKHTEASEARPSLFSRILKSVGAQTPPNASPDSSAEVTDASASKSGKKVGWSIANEFQDAPRSVAKNSPLSNPVLRPIPSSTSKPSKSILKPSNEPIRTLSFNLQANAHTPEGFAEMLESVVKQLAGEDRMTKLDAYQTLSMALKVTDDLPDPKALKDKIGLLAQFIQRDLAAVLPTEEPDNAMVTKALILLASLLWREQQVPYDFAQFFLEFSISALELGDLPKDVAKHIMFILGRQNFSSKLMSVDRVSRILNAVHRILLHYSGKSIVLGRHQVYLKLMKQARSTVIARLCWIEDTFSDMVNTTKEVRGDIIRIALELSFLAGTDPKTSKSFIELFARSHEESGGSYAEYYGNKLTTMTKAKQDVAVVPQIWTVAILLLRSKPNQLAQWQFWKPLWLQVLQKCFNSNDQEVRGHAITAWNRLVFAVQPDENTPPAMTGMLLQPFIGQLKPRPDKPPKPVTQFTYGGICNLLYYALRPSASFAQLDLHWDTYVAPLMSCLIHVDKRATNEPISPTQNQRLNYAIAIMQALLAAGSSSKPSVWLIDRAMSDERIRAEELPPIDPKWVRKNNERVLAILHPILRSSFLELHVYRGGIRQLWTNFLHCIALAGAKEIKVSQETLTCIARMFAIASDVWRNCPCDYIDITYREPNEFLWSVEFFFEEMVSKLGILPFLEKKIAVDSYARFSIAATPSTNLRTARTPLQCLVTLFTLSGGCKHNTTPLIGSFGKLFDPFHRKNMASQMELCDELFGALPIVGSNHDERNIDAVWCSLAGMYGLALVNGVPESETKPVGVFIRSYLKVLEYGLISLNQDVTNSWTDLFWAVDKSVDEKLGAGGRALGLVDPLAQSLKDHYRSTDHESFLKLFNTVLERSEYPTDAKSLQAARLKLWGPSSSTQTSTTVDPYKHLYRCINFFLLKSVDAPRHEEALSLIRQTSYLLRRCPSECFSTLLLSIGDGLALWIEDARYEAASKTSDLLGEILSKTWTIIHSRLTRNHQVDSSDLSRHAGLYRAAFSSRHKAIASLVIELWNGSYGKRDDLVYPKEVVDVLAALRKVANIRLPNFPKNRGRSSKVPPPTINLLESDEDAEPSHFANSGPPRRRSVSPLIPKPTKDVVGSSPSIRLTASSPHPILPPASASTRKRVSTKPDATPRLRHDNSQIQFAAIESSPVRETQDTQHLTENQREVKERQQEEAAAMFADLRSSPRLKKKSGILNLSSDLPDSVARSYNRPGTPTANLLAPLPGDNFIASSPTPQSRRKESQAAVLSDDEGLLIPSSPPRGRSRTPSPRAGPLTENTDAAASSKSSALHGDSSDASNTSMQQRYAGPAGSITLTAPYMRNAEQDKPDLSIEASGVQEMENNPDPTKKDGQKRKTSLSRNSSTKSEGALANITSSQQVQSSSNRKKSKKTQSERTESRPRTSDLPEKAASERPRSRSSSLSELDEEMVLSLRPPKKRSTKVVPEDNGESRPVGNEYFLLGADETFVPEEYTWIEPSPQRSPEHPSAQQRLSAKKSNFKDDTEAIGKPKATRSSERRKSQPQTDGQESFLPQSSQQNTSARSSRTPAEKSSAATATERKRKKTTQIGSDEVPARSSSVATERSRKRRKAKDTLVVVDSQQQPPASTVAEDVVTVPPMSQSSRRNRSRVDSETPSAEAQPQQKKQRLSKAEKRKRSKSRSASVATADRSEIENSQPTVLDPKESLDFPPPPKEDDVPACLSPVQEEPESGNVPKHVNAKESIDFGKPTEDETLTSSMTSSRDTENGCAEESEDAQMLDAQLSPRRESFAEQSIAEVIQTAKVATPAADSPDLDMVDIEEQIRLETSMSQSQSQSWPHSSSSAVNEPIPDQGLAQLPSYADPSSTVANTTGPVKEEQSSPTHQLSGKELGADIMERFKKIMDDLPKASLTRGEATVIEGMIWDMKAELYQAELRGRK